MKAVAPRILTPPPVPNLPHLPPKMKIRQIRMMKTPKKFSRKRSKPINKNKLLIFNNKKNNKSRIKKQIKKKADKIRKSSPPQNLRRMKIL